MARSDSSSLLRRPRRSRPSSPPTCRPGSARSTAARASGQSCSAMSWLTAKGTASTSATSERGRIDGYAVYRVAGTDPADHWRRGVFLEELCSLSDAAYVALWRYLLGVDLTDELRTYGRPVDEPRPLPVRGPTTVPDHELAGPELAASGRCPTSARPAPLRGGGEARVSSAGPLLSLERRMFRPVGRRRRRGLGRARAKPKPTSPSRSRRWARCTWAPLRSPPWRRSAGPRSTPRGPREQPTGCSPPGAPPFCTTHF